MRTLWAPRGVLLPLPELLTAALQSAALPGGEAGTGSQWWTAPGRYSLHLAGNLLQNYIGSSSFPCPFACKNL